MESQVYKFSKILFFLPFLSFTFKKYPKFEVSKSRILQKPHYVCKWRDLNKIRGGGPGDVGSLRWCRRLATLAVKELNPDHEI